MDCRKCNEWLFENILWWWGWKWNIDYCQIGADIDFWFHCQRCIKASEYIEETTLHSNVKRKVTIIISKRSSPKFMLWCDITEYTPSSNNLVFDFLLGPVSQCLNPTRECHAFSKLKKILKSLNHMLCQFSPLLLVLQNAIAAETAKNISNFWDISLHHLPLDKCDWKQWFGGFQIMQTSN